MYEIAVFRDKKADAAPLGRLQLIADEGSLRLRDQDGHETLCDETDVAAVIASTPALRKVGRRQQACIFCDEDIVGQLPLLLEPVPDDATLLVNDELWDSFPTIEGSHIMLPGHCDSDCAPDLETYWAEYRCAEGGRDFHSQLTGFASIGLLRPGVAVERGRTEYGGNGGAIAVTIWQFDDFAATFVDWLVQVPVLSNLWQGDRDISAPDIALIAEAMVAKDLRGYWEDADHAEEIDDEGESQDEDWENEGSFASTDLMLHLPPMLIDRVRSRLSSLYPNMLPH